MDLYALFDAISSNPVIIAQVPDINNAELLDGCFCIDLGQADINKKFQFFIDDGVITLTDYILNDHDYVLDEITMTFDTINDCLEFVIDNYFAAK